VAALAGKVEAVVVGTAIVRQIQADSSKLETFLRDLSSPLLFPGGARSGVAGTIS
jgi:tryptophan synthase alpha subunit